MNEETKKWKDHAVMLAGKLADAAGYLASVRTDRKLEEEGTMMALQTLEWAEGAFEYAEEANKALEVHDELIETDEQPNTKFSRAADDSGPETATPPALAETPCSAVSEGGRS